MAKEKDRRLYARFDIGFDEHDKIFPLSDAAFRALVEATLYSRRQLTDGFLAERLAVKRWGAEVLDELSANDPVKPSLVGTHYRPLNRLRDGGRERVMLSTHLKVDAVFREFALVEAPGRSGLVTRSHARSRGWVSAAAWDDIDDPAEQPQGVVELAAHRPRSVDRELVGWLHGEGLSDVEIARRLECSAMTVLRVRRELGLESRWAA